MDSFQATETQDHQNVFHNPDLRMTFGGADGV